MDVILQSCLDEFKNEYDLQGREDSEIFELFSIYCIASKYETRATINKMLLDDLNIGAGGDWGIDGFIIYVNGNIITEIQEIEDLLDANGTLEVKFVLIQAKTSPNFNIGEFGIFLDGTINILKDVNGEGILPYSNEELQKYRDIVKFIYSKSAKFLKGENPSFDIYYITSGTYNDQIDFKAKIESTRGIIEKTDLVSQFNCHMIGKKELRVLYHETKSQIEATIRVEHKIPLPDINKVEQGYLCLIPFKEFRKLIIDSDSKIRQSVFYDNIRSYQGENLVNKAMDESLKKDDLSLFTAMNNGITVITKNFSSTGTIIHLSDYQIVNGCQTCNILQRNLNRDNIDNLVLTVKIISSKDKDIRDKIIVGNNSQTEVKREQLVALLEVQKTIEEYYKAQNKYEKLYYERRSKQYRLEGSQIPLYKIITIPFQIKAFVSMIIGEPHKVSCYYGSIVEQKDNRVFAEDTEPALYYTSALACYKMAARFANHLIPTKYKKIKFHLLLAFRLMNEKTSLQHYNNKKVQPYCDSLCEILCNDEKCRMGFKKAIELVDKALGREPYDKDRTSKDFTEMLFRLSKGN